MYSELYKRTLYLSKDIMFIPDDFILEYDIKSAGFNISREFKLLPSDILTQLENQDKYSRQVSLGNLQKKFPEFKNDLKVGFEKSRQMFFEANNLQDNEILSVKKDAIFVLGKKCKHLEFGSYIKFVLKNTYWSFIKLNDYEFYFGDIFSVKGIKDEKVLLHRDFMIDSIFDFVNYMKLSRVKSAIEYIKEFATAYRKRMLNIGYYRELNPESLFRPKKEFGILNNKLGYNIFSNDLIQYLDISYNYSRYIIPMWQIVI